MNSIIIDRIPQLVELCKKYRVVRMYLFGSAARDDFDPATSDFDFLITFSTSLSFGGYADNYFDLMFELEDMFGQKIDLVTEESLASPYFIASVERTKQLIYAA